MSNEKKVVSKKKMTARQELRALERECKKAKRNIGAAIWDLDFVAHRLGKAVERARASEAFAGEMSIADLDIKEDLVSNLRTMVIDLDAVFEEF